MEGQVAAARAWHRTGPIIALVGGCGILLGSLLPWATVSSIFGSISVAGTQGDGKITAFLGAAVALMAGISLSKPRSHWERHLVLVSSLVAGAISIYDMTRVEQAVSEVTGAAVIASVGIGLWLVIGGAVISTLGAFVTDEVAVPSMPNASASGQAPL